MRLRRAPQEEVARQYAHADVFALLSRREPWGVVVNEAAASGLPLVLAEDVGAARDLLRYADNGFLDAAACAAWVHGRAGELAGSRGARGTMIDDVVEQLANVWSEPVSRPRPPVLAELP